MKSNVREPKSKLDRAVRAVRLDSPTSEAIAASRVRVKEQLFAGIESLPQDAPIRGCRDVEMLLALYRRGALTSPRALLVRCHLTECANCRELYARRGSLRLATTPWQQPALPQVASTWNRRRTYAFLVAALAACLAILAIRSFGFGVPAGHRATVEAVSGSLYRIEGAGAERLVPGAVLGEGQVVRADASPRSWLRLADGSSVEMGERAEFSVEMRAQDTTLRLNRGQIIVQAAKRTSGHLYVQTRDCRVAVTGTVFSVMTGLKGSRVSVIEGEVQVSERAGPHNVLHRGDQITTSQALERTSIEREIAWSRNLDEHLALLRELSDLKQQWRAVRSPALRYESSLVDWVPEDTVVYAALPNYAEALTEGYRLFKSKLGESSVLQKWWRSSELGQKGPRLDAMLGKMRDFSAFLGDELVIAVTHDPTGDQVLLLADVTKPGLRDWVEVELASRADARLPLTIVGVEDRASVAIPEHGEEGAILLVTPSIAALSASSDAIIELASRIDAGDPGAFASTTLGERVSRAYEAGVQLMVSADLEDLDVAQVSSRSNGVGDSSLRYLTFERQEVLGQVLNQGVLGFAGQRRGVASWLAEPGPMGSLDFLTPQASAVAAFVVKRPAEVLDDVLRLLPNAGEVLPKLTDLEQDWNLRFREDLIDVLGSELAVALDGAMLPQPAWKLVVEVREPERLERALEALVRRVDRELKNRRQGSLTIEHDRLGSRPVHHIGYKNGRLPLEVHYAFFDGYLIATPARSLLARAIEARVTGVNLAHSDRWQSLLPRDGHSSLSGFVFQDLMGVLAGALQAADPILTEERKRQLESMLSESRPSLVGFYAESDRIEMSGVGDLFPLGPEALALPGVIRHIFPESLNVPKQ